MVMPTPLGLAEIEQLFETRGHAQYDGEPVTQLEHALQSAHLAEQAGAAAHHTGFAVLPENFFGRAVYSNHAVAVGVG